MFSFFLNILLSRLMMFYILNPLLKNYFYYATTAGKNKVLITEKSSCSPSSFIIILLYFCSMNEKRIFQPLLWNILSSLTYFCHKNILLQIWCRQVQPLLKFLRELIQLLSLLLTYKSLLLQISHSFTCIITKNRIIQKSFLS